jgi:hypothetical protein
VWQNIDSFPTSQETLWAVCGPQFDTAELDVLSAFENTFDTALVELIVDETNRYAQQEISKSVKPFSGRNVRRFASIYVDGHCIRAYTSIVLRKEPATVHSIFSENLPLERLVVVIFFVKLSFIMKKSAHIIIQMRIFNTF